MIFSSDTNVWIDLEQLGATQLPFNSSHEFWMYQNAIEDEILAPPDLGRRLLELGLKGMEITLDDFYLAATFQSKYRALSKYDAIALAIAKRRVWLLLTGDGPLRKAAADEGVAVKGTLGLLDLLADEEVLSRGEYAELLERSEQLARIRWPKAEVKKRLAQLYD